MHPIRPLGIEFARPASLWMIWDLGLGSGFGTWNWDRVVVTRGHNHGPGFLHPFPSLTFVSRVLLSPRSHLLRVSLSSIVSPSIALWDAAVTFIEFIGSSNWGDRIIWFFNFYVPLFAIFHVGFAMIMWPHLVSTNWMKVWTYNNSKLRRRVVVSWWSIAAGCIWIKCHWQRWGSRPFLLVCGALERCDGRSDQSSSEQFCLAVRRIVALIRQTSRTRPCIMTS